MKIYKFIDLNIFHLIIYFTFFSFLGWTSEVIYTYFTHHHFVNRGFLTGPFCTIYGFGFILIFLSLNKFKKNYFIFFILSIIIASLLELLTGFALDKLFNIRYWNYSSYPLNINGYICLSFSLLWGVFSLFISKFLIPLTRFSVSLIPSEKLPDISFLILFYFISDLLMSINRLFFIKMLFNNICWIIGCFYSNLSTPIPRLKPLLLLRMKNKLTISFNK